MKTLDDVDALLAKRIASGWVSGSKLGYGQWETRTKAGDQKIRHGWTLRELKGLPDYVPGIPTDKLVEMLRAYWLQEWMRQDAEIAERKRLEEVKAAKAEKRAQWLEWSGCGVGLEYRNLTFDHYKPVTTEQRQALKVCENFPYHGPEDSCERAKNLWLLGPVGAGKTHLAVAVLHRGFFTDGESVLFVSQRQLIGEIRASWDDKSAPSSRDVIRKYGSVDVLVLDDVGTSHGRESEQNDLFAVIDMRSQGGLMTIITSNLPAGGIKQALGERSYSRLRDQALVVPLIGPDHRQAVPTLRPELQALSGA